VSAKRKSKQKRASAGHRPGGPAAKSPAAKSAPAKSTPAKSTPAARPLPFSERRARRHRREEVRRPTAPDDGVRARESAPLSRRDLVWAAAVAALSAILFATTLESHPGLGDAPESVAGVSSLGVLHAPGYPAYVIAARLFTLLIPFGSFALKVNLFSLVCASLSVAGVYLAARQCAAARWAAALGAFALASGGAFWFYADFAKHDMFSALLLIAGLNLLLAWQAKPTTARLVAFGAVVGVGMGSSWSLMVLILPAAAFVLFLGRRHVSLGSLAPAAAVCAVTAIGLYGFVMARAAANPAVNWGDADSLGRLADLINRADFKPRSTEGAVAKDTKAATPDPSDPKAATPNSSDSSKSASSGGSGSNKLSDTVKSIGVDARIFYAELGLAALALAFWGLIVSLSPPRAPPAYTLLVMFAVNLLVTAFTVGAGAYTGLDLVLIQEGFLLGCYLPIAVWVALGATDLAAAAAEAGSPRDPRLQRSFVAWAAPPVLGLAVVLPSLIGHHDEASRASKPFADRYAESVFGELPPRSAVFILGAERTQPLVYRQVVAKERPDVVVVATDGLSYDWYRGELADKLGRRLPPRVGLSIEDAEKVVESLRGVRPVYMDLPTAQVLRYRVGYRQVGLLARLTGGPPGPAKVPSLDRLANKVRAAERTAGLPDPDWHLWPNEYVLSSYASAMFEVADGYLRARDEQGLRRTLINVLRLQPENQQARHNLRLLNVAGLPGG
jgi:hypothetical protein